MREKDNDQKNTQATEESNPSEVEDVTKQIQEAYRDNDSGEQKKAKAEYHSHKVNKDDDQDEDSDSNHDNQKAKDEDSEWYDWDQNADRDVVIKIGPLRLYYPNYYSLVSLSLDIFVGILYFTGSLLFLSNATMMYGTILFIIGGFFFFMRPVVKLYDNFRQYNKVGLKREKDDEEFDDDKFIDVIYSEEVPEESDEENQVDDYYAEYYDS